MIYCAPPARPSNWTAHRSAILKSVVLPVVRQAEEAFSAELARIDLADLAKSATELGSLATE
jgi:hypothetical protein